MHDASTRRSERRIVSMRPLKSWRSQLDRGREPVEDVRVRVVELVQTHEVDGEAVFGVEARAADGRRRG